MVREILQISVGQCGNQIGKVFWQNILAEHHIDHNGQFIGTDIRKVEKLNVYMREIDLSKKKKQSMNSTIQNNIDALHSDSKSNSESRHLRYVPRSLLLDLEPGVIDGIRASPMGQLFAPDCMVHAVSGAGNNWAKGHYVAGAQIIDEAMDCVRKCVEDCDCLQGFQLTQALGGGTGSGFGTLVLDKLRDLYPDRINCTYSVYPAPKVSDIVVEPYNALLSIAHLMETSDETFVIDNQSLIQISDTILKQKSPSFADLNWVISLIMSGVTASLRFSGLLNSDLRKIATNLVPFPRLHFFSCSFAPLFEHGKGQYTNWSFRNITEDIWRDDHFLADIHQSDGKFLSCCINFRGEAQDTSSYAIDHCIKQIQSRNEQDFVRWIPHNVKTSIITVPPCDVARCASLISNTTSIKSVFMRISAQFASLFGRRAFLHWYTNEGMDEMEFISADSEIRDLIFEYQEKQDAVYTTPSPASTDSEMFEVRQSGKNEEEKAQAFIARKLRKLEKRIEREKLDREAEEKNKGKSVFGNIRNVKRRIPKSYQRKRKRADPGGFAEKKRAAIVWSDEEEEEEDGGLDATEEEYDGNVEEEYDGGQKEYDENGNYDEEHDKEHGAEHDHDAVYDENYDEEHNEEHNEEHDHDAVYDENYDENYDEHYDEHYDENYDENYDGQYAENYEEDYVDAKKKKKEDIDDDLGFLESD